jgi:beta-galactosidase
MRPLIPPNAQASAPTSAHPDFPLRVSFVLCLGVLLAVGPAFAAGAEPPTVSLPEGVDAVWNINKAYHETTPTRERICLNGLWQWQPAEPQAKEVPENDWGYFKVPGAWPGITDYMQKDSQTLYSHPTWASRNLAEVSAAWYQRELTIPHGWANRRISVSFEYLNSYAVVYMDGKRVGEATFPGGAVELPADLQASVTYKLSLLVIAMPLKGVMLSYTDSAAAREQRGSVPRRGLCGDVFLVSLPNGPHLTDVRVETSVRKKELRLSAALHAVAPSAEYALKVRVLDSKGVVKEFTPQRFQTNDLNEGRISFTQPWLPEKLWDTHTPQNIYSLEVSLLDSPGKTLDTAWTVPFGFRELWIDGRDFFLNGTRIFLSAVPLDNAQVSAALTTYSGARESLERLKSFGINFVYTHNYGCEPGAHLAFDEILKAADDVGMLVSFSQPHFSHYDWTAHDADQNNGYSRHAAYYVRAAQNHPSVVMYSMSHNATGYEEDMNPDMIDGIHGTRDTWALKNMALATRAEAIVKHLDPSRIVYHHASGNLGSMHPINFYPNFVPIQELSDWFEHWSTQGVKPVFTCEYGAPFTWDWTMYRGWYKGQREFGSAAVPWEFCLAEWNAQFLGDAAFAISEEEKKNLRWEAQQFHAGKLWHRWDYPVDVGSSRLVERYPVFAMYLKDNWRAFRTWGVSAVSPWEFEHFWKLRDGLDRRRQDFKVDWQNLQRPGFSPDYLDQRYERVDLAYNLSDWEPTVAAQALMANNRPLLAYIAGKPKAFTSKDHIFFPGEKVEKQLIIINNSRETVSVGYQWSFQGPGSGGGSNHIAVNAGRQERVPFSFELPGSAQAGAYELTLLVKFSNGELQSDSFAIDVVPRPPSVALAGKVALFDPKDDTKPLLGQLGLRFESVDADADLSGYDLLIVGKAALTVDGPAPDISRVRAGLKVIVFEQTSAVLEKRFGFRVEEYGLRQVFPRIADHPVLAGLKVAQLRDWRGEATILSSRLTYQVRPRYGPTVQWCGIPVPHLWRCGNRGNVASVLIEKPMQGDFLPILDGGFSLQYSPLLEYREGRGMLLFCQMDLTARTESEPAADILALNLLRYVSAWTPPPRRAVLYAGEQKGRHHLESVGISAGLYSRSKLSAKQILVVGPGGADALTGESAALAAWLKTGGELLAVGLSEDKLNSLLPFPVGTRNAEHISCVFKPFELNSVFAGIGPADLHNRDPRDFPLISSGAEIVGDGALAYAHDAGVVFCQVAPWQFSDKQPNLKRTHRRASFLLSRLLANMGADSSTPLLDWFHHPQSNPIVQDRCRSGLYIDQPEEWDDPYRHFRW